MSSRFERGPAVDRNLSVDTSLFESTLSELEPAQQALVVLDGAEPIMSIPENLPSPHEDLRFRRACEPPYLLIYQNVAAAGAVKDFQPAVLLWQQLKATGS